MDYPPTLVFGEFYTPPNEITPLLWVGNYLNGAELYIANPNAFKSVLNVSTEGPYRKNPGVAYLEVPFKDGGAVPADALRAVADFLVAQHEARHKTLVHCAAGISRSVTMVAMAMHLTGQLPFDGALQFVRQQRTIALPHPFVTNSVRKWLKVWPYDGSLGEPTS